MEVDRDNHGRYILVKAEFEKKIYLFTCIYAPNNDKPTFFHQVFEKYTWGRKASNLKERLDCFLINQELYQEVECVGITTGYKTDHCMVIIVILIESNERGPGFWKFNKSLLEDAD